MPAPTGEIFEHDGMTYVIEPKVLSKRCIEALLRVYRQGIRREIKEHQQYRDELGDDLFEEMKLDLMSAARMPGMQEAVKALQTFDGMASTLHICCDQINTLEDAKHLIGVVPNIMKLFKGMAASMQQDLEAEKNSPPQNQTQILEVPLKR